MNQEGITKWGGYRGAVSETFRDTTLPGCLHDMPALLARGSVVGAAGRNQMVRVDLERPEGVFPLAIKSFGSQPAWKDWTDRFVGSKAARSWHTACALYRHGVGTPCPVGYVERWEGARLRESYYLSKFEPDLSDFRKELVRLFRHEPESVKLIPLLQVVADEVRAMHEAGVFHRDLGNQNIQLRRAGPAEWTTVQFVDLNRSRRCPSLSLRKRARDISRVYLPSELLRIFKQMYFRGEIPSAFERWEQRYRRMYAFHSRSRKYRHPFRGRGPHEPVDDTLAYPDEKDIWIWDEPSSQAINVIKRKQRNRIRSKRSTLRTATAALEAFPRVWRDYRTLLAGAFQQRVELENRVGLTLEPPPGKEDEECARLRELGALPVLLRLYHHKGREELVRTLAFARRLHEEGHSVAAALVQDRRAITEPASWKDFISHSLGELGAYAEWIEVGHAVNRLKWGIWDLDEYQRLMEPVSEWSSNGGPTHLMGPACIDFEFPHLLAFLRHRPGRLKWDALSHHLYVDRRGAPENKQGKFGALEKLALARAIARSSDGCDERLIVSEVNWPLLDGGTASPIGSPYLYPGQQLVSPPSVTEDAYADFMVRFLVIALCSGLTERVYWWRLVARGFGLLDRGPDGIRTRPAFRALQTFLVRCGTSTFTGRERTQDGVQWYHFEQGDGQRDVLAYHPRTAVSTTPPFAFRSRCNRDGDETDATKGTVPLNGAPTYFLDVS